MDPTCINLHPLLPSIPNLTNSSIPSFNHPTYQPERGGLTQLISTSLIRKVFSNEYIRSLLDRVADGDEFSTSASDIIKMEPISSLLAYGIVTICLCLILSLTFCIVSCVNFKKNTPQPYGRKRRSTCLSICVCLLGVVYLLGIGDLIYVAVRANKSKVAIDETIEDFNGDIYPRDIVEHLIYVSKQVHRLDDYVSQPNTIVINGSRAMLITSFGSILEEKYFLDDLLRESGQTNVHVKELESLVEKDSTIPAAAKLIFSEFLDEHREMIKYLNNPLEILCTYENGTQTDIDGELLKALKNIDDQLKKILQFIENDLLFSLTPWQAHLLFSKDVEDKIRHYHDLGQTIFLALVIVFGAVPVLIFIAVAISCLCRQDSQNGPEKYHNDFPLSDYAVHRPKQKRAKVQLEPEKSSCCGCLCLIRVIFGLMFILIIAIALVTVFYYAVDIAFQGSCRMVHEDQPFLISFLTNELLSDETVDANKTIIQVIDDCREGVHFSDRFLANYWPTVDQGIEQMMKMLNQEIFDQFHKSIGQIKISKSIDQLIQFANLTAQSVIFNKVITITQDLKSLQTTLIKINNTDANLPRDLVQSTIDQFHNFTTDLLESTVDPCPLPLATIYQADQLICHDLVDAFSGLWLSVFIFLMLTLIGLCIFGLCIYKRLN